MSASNRKFLVFVSKMLAIFSFLYVGSFLAYGAGYPGGILDSPFIHKWFYYQQGLREVYLSNTSAVFGWMDIETFRESATTLHTGRGGVGVNDACLGFGLFSFWIAFTVADSTPLKKKLSWLVGGLIVLFFLNQLRVIVVLAVMHYKWVNLYTIDHHLVFNIICYIAIFILLWLYSRSNMKVMGNPDKPNPPSAEVAVV